jgi:hypothetical protein
LTPRVGPNFGTGAEFSVNVRISLGRKFTVVVKAVGVDGTEGDLSQGEDLMWAATLDTGPQVPWPARPVPALNVFSPFLLGARLPDDRTPMGVLIGAAFARRSTTQERGPSTLTGWINPMDALWTNSVGQPLFPVAMYRAQVSNTLFPSVSGDLTQVTPLMEQIAYRQTTDPNGGQITEIYDPFIGVIAGKPGATELPAGIYLLDTQPVIVGAVYRYLLVRFDPATKEIVEVIPTNPVEVTP